MHVDRAGAEVVAARHRHPGPALAGEQRAEHDDRRPHPLDELVGRLGRDRRRAARPAGRVGARALDRAAHRAQQLAHACRRRRWRGRCAARTRPAPAAWPPSASAPSSWPRRWRTEPYSGPLGRGPGGPAPGQYGPAPPWPPSSVVHPAGAPPKPPTSPRRRSSCASAPTATASSPSTTVPSAATTGACPSTRRRQRRGDDRRSRRAAPFWGLVFVPRLPLGVPPRRPGPAPWWAPPERLDRRAGDGARRSCCSVSVVGGYLGTRHHPDGDLRRRRVRRSATGAQSVAPGGRCGPASSSLIVLVALADRFGRRRLITIAAAAGVHRATATGALGAERRRPRRQPDGRPRLQRRAAPARSPIMSAEEMPAGSRAWAYSLIAMTRPSAPGMCLWVLPLADLAATRAWRVALRRPAALPADRASSSPATCPRAGGSRHRTSRRPIAGHGRRFWLLAVTGLPARLLRHARQPARQRVPPRRAGLLRRRASTIFTLLTATPAAIGVIVGGRLADVRGRRLVGAIGHHRRHPAHRRCLRVDRLGAVVLFDPRSATSSPPLTVPALGVYRPELFPTSLRGRAAGFIELLGVAGASAGLLLVGLSVDAGGQLTARPSPLPPSCPSWSPFSS